MRKGSRITVGDEVVTNETHDGLGDIASVRAPCAAFTSTNS